MKKTILFILISISIYTVHAQIYPKGKIDLNLGLGLGATIGGAGLSTTIPPVGISVNYGIQDDISVGLYLGYFGASADLSVASIKLKLKYGYTIIGARGSYFFDIDNEKLEPYAGLLLGYNIASVKYVGDLSLFDAEPSDSEIGYSIFGGARYTVSDKLKIFGELGYGIAVLQLGVVMNLNDY